MYTVLEMVKLEIVWDLWAVVNMVMDLCGT